jgi:threonyl-tRNA synthetase
VSHVMAQAVKRLFPATKLAIGPAINNGFYYDFDSEHTFTPDDLALIEKEMAAIVKSCYPLQREIMGRGAAAEMFAQMGETYKVEIIDQLSQEAQISVYRQGEFVDLCAGPHVPSTGAVKAFKLQSIAGAYWRGDDKNQMLQRIYGTAFAAKSKLDDYLHMLEEAARRDHRKLGRELDIFSLQDEGPGFPFFHPNGMVIRNQVEAISRKFHFEFGYDEIKTPIILTQDLWVRSGHWDHYRDNMYFTSIDGEPYAIKPMNCPGCILVYRSHHRSYRDLPVRMFELGQVHRHELSGALHGLMRVRSFTQDDAHIFMTPGQIKEEIKNVIKLFDRLYSVYGLKYSVELSTKPEKAMGDDAVWELATQALRDAMEEYGLNYKVNPGDGAFYGPKIDFHLQDSLGRTWQCGTIQLDMQMPEKFDLNYTGEDGQKHRPVMIHRALYGSMERFIGILIEHYAGSFPVWLAPKQARILPIAERHLEYAENLRRRLAAEGIRVYLDERNEKIGYKIRDAQMQKVPYMLIVGDKEAETGTVAVRERKKGNLGQRGVEEFIAKIKEEIAERT